MVLFTSMNAVFGYTALTVFVLIWFGTGRFPARPFGSMVRELLGSPKFLVHFICLVAILMFNNLELKLEKALHVGTDFTRYFHALEGGFASGFQHLFVTPWLTPILAYMYVVVFQSLLMASIGIYAYRKEKRMFYALCYAVFINYLVALPFYLFFPIREVWSYDPSVRFVMLDAFPTFESQYRALSGIDNCFPSLHTSISLTMALLAFRSGNRRWAWFCAACAGLIVFTIFYMGIHWVTDSIGGVLLALLASGFAMKLTALRSLRPAPQAAAARSGSPD